MARRPQRYTVYDMMEDRGVFSSNVANVHAVDQTTGESLYAGPVEFPKMFYHPEGKTRVTVPAEIITTPLGPKAVGEQRELINQMANNAEEEAKLREAGWHDHPAKAIAAAGGPAPSMGAAHELMEKEEKIRRMQLELDELRARELARQKAAGVAANPLRKSN